MPSYRELANKVSKDKPNNSRATSNQQHIEPVINIIQHGNFSQTQSSLPTDQMLMDTFQPDNLATKRSSSTLSPEISEIQKRYRWNPDSVLRQNKYYLPADLETQITGDENPVETTVHDKNIKIPPIFLHEADNHIAIINDIKKFTKNGFSTAYGSKYIRINLTSSDDYRSLTKYYSESKLKYHTFQNPADKPHSVVIKNVPISLTEEDIETELKQLYPDLTIIKTTRLLNKNKHPIPVCALDFVNSDEVKQIYQLERLYHTIVTVEPRRKSSEIPQCVKCQRFGHTKNYCSLDPRCVKCLGNHLYNECTKKKDEPPACVNCGEAHSANYRGCRYFQELKSRIYSSQHKQLLNTSPSRQSTKPVTANLKYSQVVNEHPINKPTEPHTLQSSSTLDTSAVSTILTILLQLLTPYLPQIKNFILQNVIPLILNIP